VCFYLFLGSPLTLSEIRSMLPRGFSADLTDPADHRMVREEFPDAQTVVRLLHGACSCDFVRQRHPVTREDEARLRRRYRDMGLGREATIRAIERHRRVAERPHRSQEPCAEALAAFVVEHARNAGPSWYLLRFTADAKPSIPPKQPPITRTAAQVRATPDFWLEEDQPIIIVPS